MEYRVELTDRAFADLDAIFVFVRANESPAAFHWFNNLEAMIFSLDRMPERGTRTREDSNLRQLLYGNKPHIYRIIFRVDREEQRVLILHIRHGAREDFQPADVSIQ